MVVIAKNALVVLSLICSMICMINVLYDQNAEKMQVAMEENNKLCDEKWDAELADLDTWKEEEIQRATGLYDNELNYINTLQDELNQLNDQIRQEIYINKRGDLQNEAEKIRLEVKELNESYNSKIDSISKDVEEEYDIRRSEIEEQYGETGNKRLTSNDPEIQIEGDNEYLSNFLLAITQTFFQSYYSRTTYFICAIIISMIISVVLELCISISQMLLTLSVEEFMILIGKVPKIEKGQKVVQVSVWLMFSILVTTSAYLVASIVLNVNIDQCNIKIALLTYAATILMINVLTPHIQKRKGMKDVLNKHPKTKTVVQGIDEMLMEAFVPAAVSFVGYILIGIIFEGEFTFGDMNGLAIAIGGCFSKIIKYNECAFAFDFER